MHTVKVGSRLYVFDPSLYLDDITTPLTHTMRPATVRERVGDRMTVEFDHRPGKLSPGHFIPSNPAYVYHEPPRATDDRQWVATIVNRGGGAWAITAPTETALAEKFCRLHLIGYARPRWVTDEFDRELHMLLRVQLWKPAVDAWFEVAGEHEEEWLEYWDQELILDTNT